jgi:uncharacterized protein
MKIGISRYKEGTITRVQQDYDPKALDLEYVDLKYVKPLVMNGTIEMGHDTVTFSGNLRSEVIHVCGRCLKEVPESLEIPFRLYYETKDRVEIDTTDDLRETALMIHSMNYLCKSECRGLCQQCGADLNEGSCRCQQPPSPGFEKLARFRRIKKEDDHAKS